jgi:hypothetical protein
MKHETSKAERSVMAPCCPTGGECGPEENPGCCEGGCDC